MSRGRWWWRWVVAVELILPAVAWANPYQSVIIGAEPLGGCKVQVVVRRIQGDGADLQIRRSRARFALPAPACSQSLAALSTLKGVPDKPVDPALATHMLGAVHRYDTFTLEDEVCGDGRWWYQAHDPTFPAREDAIDFDATTPVDVSGCHPAKPCTAREDAPGTVEQVERDFARCIGWGYMSVGDEQPVNYDVAEVVKGKGVVELSGKGAHRRVRALKPGGARAALRGSGASHECIDFTVRLKQNGPIPFEDKEAWAYRDLDLAPAHDDQVVDLSDGGLWTLPLSGKLEIPNASESVARLSVDDQCRPALVASSNHEAFSGCLLTEASGRQHTYLLSRIGEDLRMACHMNSHDALVQGATFSAPHAKVRVGGSAVLVPVGDDRVYAASAGTAYYSDKPGSPYCTRLEVSAPLATPEARIDWLKSRMSSSHWSSPHALRLTVGQSTAIPIDASKSAGGISESHLGEALDVAFGAGGIEVKGVSPGFEAVLVGDPRGPVDFWYVEVEGPAPRAPGM